MNNNKDENKITKNVWVLGFTSLLNDASKTLLTLILPLYLAFVIGAGEIIIGIIVGLSASVGSVANAVTGYLSDKTKKTKFYTTFGYALLPISRLLLLFAGTWPVVLVLRVVNDIGEGMKDSPRDVILTTSVSKKVRGKAYGIHRTLHTIGAIIGTLIAIYFLFGIPSPADITQDTYNLIFIISSVLVATGVIILYIFLDEKEKPLKVARKIKFDFINREFKLFVIIAGIFSLGNFAVWFMIMKTADALTMSSNIFGSPELALAYLMFPVIFAIFATPIGALSDKVSRRLIISSGYALFGVICIGFIFVSSLIGFMLLFALYGIFWATTHAMQRAFTVDLVGGEKRGTALGVFHSVAGVLAFPANVIAGYLWTVGDPGTATFLFGAVIAFISAFLLFFLLKK
ncbi:hypothetical protein BEH94_01475 [Candidatus Altiarchaeales archaeon WOR_SM1_SCG]|nr:hypothetical protein BEH94_01475 [Candidatus Altiarchaeales archaeon WOR_SM1_SCG]